MNKKTPQLNSVKNPEYYKEMHARYKKCLLTCMLCFIDAYRKQQISTPVFVRSFSNMLFEAEMSNLLSKKDLLECRNVLEDVLMCNLHTTKTGTNAEARGLMIMREKLKLMLQLDKNYRT